MKNPQNYTKYYERWNSLCNDIITNIRVKLEETKTKSVDLAITESDVIINETGLGQDEIAMGLVLRDDKRVMVHYGQYEADQVTSISHLDTHQLLRLFKVFEEAIYDYNSPPFKG